MSLSVENTLLGEAVEHSVDSAEHDHEYATERTGMVENGKDGSVCQQCCKVSITHGTTYVHQNVQADEFVKLTRTVKTTYLPTYVDKTSSTIIRT